MFMQHGRLGTEADIYMKVLIMHPNNQAAKPTFFSF